MSLLRFLSVLLLALTTLSTVAAETEPEEVRQLRWVQQANPITDAEAAVERKNFVLLGVRGYTWKIPGTEESKKFEYREKYGVKLLEGTGDVILGSEHGHLIKLATEYAKNTTNMYSVMPIKSSCALTLRSSGTAQKRVAS